MGLRGTIAIAFIWLALEQVIALANVNSPNVAGGYRDWKMSQPSKSRRQIPVIVGPPTPPKPITYTPLVPQPTSSLNYWWPYGSNGVNPTATPTPAPAISSAVDTDTAGDSTPETTSTDDVTTSSSSYSSSHSSSTTTTRIMTELPIPPPIPDPQGFRVISLLPLFIILGVIALATFVGWTYGKCTRWCQNRKESTPGGPNIGGRPYEFGGYDSDTIGPMRSVGMGWVDASRMYDYNVSSGTVYHAARAGQGIEEPGTPSKNKNRSSGTGWFRHTFSRKGRLNLNSPSREKGLGHPTMGNARNFGPVPATAYDQLNSQRASASPSFSGSPKLLRVTNGSPAALDNGAYSPLGSSQPTPYVSASCYGTLHRKILDKVGGDDGDYFLAASRISGPFAKPEEYDKREEDWVTLKVDSPERSPARRFNSSDTPTSPKSLTRSPDPQQHRARMRRLRAAAQAGVLDPNTISPSRPPNTEHPLPPGSPAVLSPPLRAHLFFDGNSSKELGVCGTRGFSGEPVRSSMNNDPFGLCVAPSTQPMRRGGRNGGNLFKKRTESTETVPLSPELRDAAMTRFEEVVKTSWSTRNLAEATRSPTMFGALSPPPGQGFYGTEGNSQSEGEKESLIVLSGDTRKLST